MLRHPAIPVAKSSEYNHCNGCTYSSTEKHISQRFNERNEVLLIRTSTQDENQYSDGRHQHPDEGQSVEELSGYHEGGQQESTDLIVTRGKWVIHPTAAHEESPLAIVVHVRQRPEAVHPQSQAIQLGARDAVITDQPTGRCKCNHDEGKGEHEDANATTSG